VNKSVTFSLNGTSVGTAMTNSSGVATLSNVSLTGINAGSYATAIGAGFASDATHATSSGTGALTVNKATATVTLTQADLSQTFGATKSVGYTTSPANLTGVALTYAELATVPTNAGSYTVKATLTNGNYQLVNAENNQAITEVVGTLTVAKANQTITWSNPTGITFGTALSSTQLNATTTGDGVLTYTPLRVRSSTRVTVRRSRSRQRRRRTTTRPRRPS
jgi:hypothetical protein